MHITDIGQECEACRRKIKDNEIVVDEAMLKETENGLQTVLDCLPDNTVIKLMVEEISSLITITKPVTLISGLKSTKLTCTPDEGRKIPLQIRFKIVIHIYDIEKTGLALIEQY